VIAHDTDAGLLDHLATADHDQPRHHVIYENPARFHEWLHVNGVDRNRNHRHDDLGEAMRAAGREGR
jgi:hypothetical protein